MESQMLDRLWTEIDNNVGRVEKLSRVVYEQAVTLRIVSMVVWVIVFTILGSAVAINWGILTPNNTANKTSQVISKANNLPQATDWHQVIKGKSK